MASSASSISYYRFPLDLLSERYNGNFVKINILIDEQTTASTDETVLNTAKINSGSSSVSVQANSTEMLSASGIHSGKKLFSDGIRGVASSIKQQGKLLATSAILEKRTRSLRRLATGILLPLPAKLDYAYGATWNEISLKSLSQSVETVKQISATNEDWGDKLINSTKTMAASTISTGDDMSSSNGDFANAYYQQLGIATNQFKDAQFGGMETRECKLDFKFVPKSKEEFKQVTQIIKTLKLHEHPTFYDSDRLLLVYPDLFEIEFYVGGKKAEFLPKYLNSCLKSIEVTYGEDGGDNYGFKTFESEAPTVINLSLRFGELVQLTRQDIEEGY